MPTAIVLGVGILLLALAYWLARPRDRRTDSGSTSTATPAKRTPHPAAEPHPLAAQPKHEPAQPKPEAAAAKPQAAPPEREERPAPAPALPRIHEEDDDESDIDLTLVTLGPSPDAPPVEMTQKDESPPIGGSRRDRARVSSVPEPPAAIPIVYDDDAATDEPTRATALILVSAAGQTDLGQRRKNNEDSYLVLEELGVFVVADGMGGYAGGEIASQLAVDVIEKAFRTNTFEGDLYPTVPRRGSELAQAIQTANEAIFNEAQANRELAEMGTTIVSARFSPNKQRLYIGHVGDSRCYRLREGELTQVTTDHTMAALGMKGPFAHRLNRAVGIAPRVKIDLIIARPQPDDLYVLCSDGLSKMVPVDAIQETLLTQPGLEQCVASLIDQANASGGRDNITVVLVQVKSPVDICRENELSS